MIGGSLGEIPMTGGKLGKKQSERIVNMVSKHWATYSTIYLHMFIGFRCLLKILCRFLILLSLEVN